MDNDVHTIKSGHLKVDALHKIYWEDWGNPAGAPILFLHGGPGGGLHNRYKLMFNPLRHRVIFFDQRGSGKSTPYASIKNNTTEDLVNDIEKLRKHLNLGKIHLVGRSWGSTLALAYSIAHPDKVIRMLIGGVYLGTEFESNFIVEGYMKYTYPEAWDRFISLVPKGQRTNGSSITQYYADKLHSKDKSEAQKYADEWSLWEATATSVNYDQWRLESDVLGNLSNLPLARLETHYSLNNYFMPENYIIDNVPKIKHIPCYVIQGRFDNCTPPITAYRLAGAYGENLTLQWVNAGHRSSEPEIFAVERAVANTFLG